MPNKIFNQLINPTKSKADNIPPQDVAFNKLYFINLLNKAGVNDKPTIFKDYFTAAKSCPSLAKICDKLTNSELQNLINRIEDIL